VGRMKVKIGNKLIGEGEPCFIIAEAGINHNGDITLAKMLIDAAKEAGADAVKFQTHLAEKEMLKGEITADYIGEPVFNLIKRMELSKEQHQELTSYCEDNGIIFLSTGYCKEAVDLLDEFGLPLLKVGSGEVTNLPLIEYIAKKGKPMIVSTGMTTMEELKLSVELIKKLNDKLILLQCTSTYPTKYEDVQLKGIEQLRKEFEVPVGFSDHSIGIYIPLAAVALGACVIEKHFTMDRNLPGPDQKASIEPDELKELVKGIRAIEDAMKKPKAVVEGEKEVQNFARESVVSILDIPKETIITNGMVDVKRPGIGIPAKDLNKVIGKKTKNAIKKNSLIKWGDLY
jgi:N-acetylneuraminate synthase/N,N'-diacetyllegionaminate synthase